MRALPFGIWAGVTMPDGANYAPDYGPQLARSYTRARQHLQSAQPTPNAYIGVHTAFALLPWGDLTAGAPERWLLVVTAVGRHVDTDGAEMHAGEAYLLSWDATAARWQPSSLPRKVAQQYYYDWGRQQGTHPIQRPCPHGETYPLGQWEQMAMNFIPNPISTQHRSYRDGGTGTQTHPAPQPAPAPGPEAPMPDQDHPSLMQHREVANTQHDSQVEHESHGGGQAVQSIPREVALMLRWLRELAAWGSAQHLPMQMRYELEGTIAVLEEGLSQAKQAQPRRGQKRTAVNSVRAARLRLLDVWHEGDDENGLNQHQIFEDLKSVLMLLREGSDQFHSVTQGQGGNLLRNGAGGLRQATTAVQHAQEATVEGDLDWCSGSWGAAVAMLLEDAEQAVDEHAETNLVHSADVLALQQGGEEVPQRPKDSQAKLEAILGDIRNALGFLTARQHAQVLNVLAMMAMWQTQQGAHVVDTQTTDEGGELGANCGDSRSSWQPAPGVEQWSGSIPSSRDEGWASRSTEDEGGPTDADLLCAMEEYERQQEEEAAQDAEREASMFTRRRTESDLSRRRRQSAAFEGEP